MASRAKAGDIGLEHALILPPREPRASTPSRQPEHGRKPASRPRPLEYRSPISRESASVPGSLRRAVTSARTARRSKMEGSSATTTLTAAGPLFAPPSTSVLDVASPDSTVAPVPAVKCVAKHRVGAAHLQVRGGQNSGLPPAAAAARLRS
jgi:hypothetical protein